MASKLTQLANDEAQAGFYRVDASGIRTQETRIMHLLITIWRDSQGATAIEYGLIAALIGAAMITALTGLGIELDNTMTTAGNAMAAQSAAA